MYEPTGPNHCLLEIKLAGRLTLVKVNPLQARRFAQAHGARAKTDKADARMLAMMGRALELCPDQIMTMEQRELKELQVARAGLVHDRTALMNRLRSQHLALIRRLTRANLAQTDRQIKALDAAIQ